MSVLEGLLATIGAKGRSVVNDAMSLPNPGGVVATGVNKVTDPNYPVDAALRQWVANVPAFQPTIGGMLQKTGTDLLDTGTGFVTALQRGDYESAINSPFFPMGGMTVYHGSPHRFDAFDLSKIGTGEGAQAYGHGLYFAENPEVASNYMMAGRNVGFNNRDSVPQLMQKSLAMAAGDRQKAAEILRNELGKTNGQTRALNIELAVKNVLDGKGETGLYHVDIPDDEIAKMLDWDKPLSEQPESVRKALESFGIGSKKDPDLMSDLELIGATGGFENTFGKGEATGKKLYKELQSYFGGDKAASDALREAGIPGIRYFDGGSRGAGEGTRNIVLFDDKLAKILKRE